MKPEAVLITGANNRIGFEIAKEALRLNYRVIIHYRSSKEPAYHWLKCMPNLIKKVWFMRAELTESPQQLISEAIKLPVTLVGLVNNASVFTKGNLNNLDHFFSVLQINSFVPVRLSMAFSNYSKKGWIINITDAHIRSPNREFQNYRISKELLTIFTRQLAFLLAPSIRVNAIAPGAILAAKGRENIFKRLPKQIPLRKTGTPSSITQAFNYLVTNDYVTGEILHIDGGWNLL